MSRAACQTHGCCPRMSPAPLLSEHHHDARRKRAARSLAHPRASSRILPLPPAPHPASAGCSARMPSRPSAPAFSALHKTPFALLILTPSSAGHCGSARSVQPTGSEQVGGWRASEPPEAGAPSSWLRPAVTSLWLHPFSFPVAACPPVLLSSPLFPWEVDLAPARSLSLSLSLLSHTLSCARSRPCVQCEVQTRLLSNIYPPPRPRLHPLKYESRSAAQPPRASIPESCTSLPDAKAKERVGVCYA